MSLRFSAGEAEDGSVLQLLFRSDTFKEQSQMEEPRADPAGGGGQGRGSGAPSHRSVLQQEQPVMLGLITPQLWRQELPSLVWPASPYGELHTHGQPLPDPLRREGQSKKCSPRRTWPCCQRGQLEHNCWSSILLRVDTGMVHPQKKGCPRDALFRTLYSDIFLTTAHIDIPPRPFPGPSKLPPCTWADLQERI